MHPNVKEIHDIQALRLENAKLREFAALAWQIMTRNEPLHVWQGMVDDARELGLEEMTDGRADD